MSNCFKKYHKKITTSTYHIAQDRSSLNSIGRCYPNKNFKWSENSIYNELQCLMPSDYWKIGLSPEHLGVWLPFVAFTGLVGLTIRTELPQIFSSMVRHHSFHSTKPHGFKTPSEDPDRRKIDPWEKPPRLLCGVMKATSATAASKQCSQEKPTKMAMAWQCWIVSFETQITAKKIKEETWDDVDLSY